MKLSMQRDGKILLVLSQVLTINILQCMQKTARKTTAIKLWIDFISTFHTGCFCLFILVCFVWCDYHSQLKYADKHTINSLHYLQSINEELCKHWCFLMKAAFLLVNLLGLGVLECFMLLKINLYRKKISDLTLDCDIS